MIVRRLAYLGLLMTLAMVLLGCNSDGSGEAEIDLPQSDTFDYADGQYTIHYPEGWVLGADSVGLDVTMLGFIELGTRQALLDGSPDELAQLLQPGDVAIIIFAGTKDEDTDTPEAMVASLLENQAETEGIEADMSEVESYQVDGRAAAIAHGIAKEGDVAGGVIFSAVEMGDFAAALLVTMPVDEVDSRVPLIRAITGQMEFTPGQSPE
jgi:hypothetical protein